MFGLFPQGTLAVDRLGERPDVPVGFREFVAEVLHLGGKHEQPMVRVRGHLTTDTAGAFTTSLVASGVSLGPAVVVDLSGVTRIDRCGLSALQICERSLAEEGSQLILKRAS